MREKNEKRTQEKGITLIALVVTIVVLLILAGVSITVLFGDSGIIKMAQEAADKTNEAAKKDRDDLAKLDEYLTSGNWGETTTPTDPEYPKKENISKETSYVGYYADFTGAADGGPDGVVDGIIYADLAVGTTGSGQWGNDDGKYSISRVENVKDYYISQESYVGNFGPEAKTVISPIKESTGVERFYIMSLEDVQLEHPIDETLNIAYWYYNAAGKMADYDTYTLRNFGTGKENTKKMIARWKKDDSKVTNAKEIDYGETREQDLWGQIDKYVEEGWFVPSKEEWSAFGGELGITVNNYTNYNLNGWYWSSSQLNEIQAWIANYEYGNMDGNVAYDGSVARCSYTRLTMIF